MARLEQIGERGLHRRRVGSVIRLCRHDLDFDGGGARWYRPAMVDQGCTSVVR